MIAEGHQEIALWTPDGHLVGRFDVLPFKEGPHVVVWPDPDGEGDRYFMYYDDSPGDFCEAEVVHFLTGKPKEDDENA